MSHPVCILCPGQGAQVVGMGKDFAAASPVARELYDNAREVLGYDLAAICFDGPEERLNQTDICQPAIYVTSIAAFRAAQDAGLVGPLVSRDGAILAGLSLGEYTALQLAGALSFEDGLRLVAARGRLMQEAAVAVPSGMVAILGGDEPMVTALYQQCANGEVLVPANFNSPGQIVASGGAAACERLAKAAEAKGLRAVPLKVAGAFPSAIMEPAAQRMREELAKVTMRAPVQTVYANVTAGPHGDIQSIKELLVRQIVSPVRWEQTMRAILAAGQWRMVELAPGRTLTGMLKKIDRRLPVESWAAADVLVAKEKP
jgi:[acyl-carrier-protein] S-malonyltransferase